MPERFNPPPGWHVPPGFEPPPGWQPDPSWPPAPAGWTWWVADQPYAQQSPYLGSGGGGSTQVDPRLRRRRGVSQIVSGVVILVFGLVFMSFTSGFRSGGSPSGFLWLFFALAAYTVLRGILSLVKAQSPR